METNPHLSSRLYFETFIFYFSHFYKYLVEYFISLTDADKPEHRYTTPSGVRLGCHSLLHPSSSHPGQVVAAAAEAEIPRSPSPPGRACPEHFFPGDMHLDLDVAPLL